MDQQQQLCFVLSVWNDLYVDLYLKYALPSQLAFGNLDSLDRSKSIYCIYTRAMDKARLKAHPLFNQLELYVDVRFTIITEDIKDNRLRAGYYFGLGVEYAKSINAAVVLIMPDVLFSAGTFKYMLHQLQQGYRAILLACHTTEIIQAETLLKQYTTENSAINLNGRDCVDIVMQAMHPNSQEKFFLDTKTNLMPACLCWYVGSEGILTHAFHLTPLVVFPQNMQHRFLGTIDREFILEANIANDEILVVQDSDECCMFELADANHIVTSPYKRANADHVVDWAIIHGNVQHRAVFSTPIRLKSNRYNEANEQRWLQVEQQAHALVEYVENVLNQKNHLLTHYFKFKYAYLRKFLLKMHGLEWQGKNYRGRFLIQCLIKVHNIYLKFAAGFAAIQKKQMQSVLDKLDYWPRKLEDNVPFVTVFNKIKQAALNSNSPMLLQIFFFPFKLILLWFGLAIFNLLVGGLQIARN